LILSIPLLEISREEPLGFNGSSQKSLMVKIFVVGHRKIVDFPALAKNDKQWAFLQKSDAFLPQFNPKGGSLPPHLPPLGGNDEKSRIFHRGGI
ncbi:MAG: hypothetical protein IJS60_01225, partial [Abditibacteriota bacterium]|nr:hypothetical protein [Abditibacteriota bacterium]